MIIYSSFNGVYLIRENHSLCKLACFLCKNVKKEKKMIKFMENPLIALILINDDDEDDYSTISGLLRMTMIGKMMMML